MEWRRVVLSAADVGEAGRIARVRQGESAGWVANKGTATPENDRVGALGEVAVARWFLVRHPLEGQAGSWVSERSERGGLDVAGYEVRSASNPAYRLVVRDSDLRRDPSTRLLLALVHECPVVWLAGQVTLGEAVACAEGGYARGHVIRFAPQSCLRLVPPPAFSRLMEAAGHDPWS